MLVLFKKTLTFAINYSQFTCVHSLENIFIIISEPLQCFYTRRLWIKQRSTLVNRTVVTKLQFIRIKHKLFTPTDEEQSL